MSSYAVEAKNLTRKFGDFYAVKGLNLEIKSGLVYGFLGPNGCGKTTTLRMLSGVLEPSDGEVLYFGKPTKEWGENIRSKIGYMSQRFSLYNELSCYENLHFYGGIYGLEKSYLKDRIEQLFEMTNLDKFKDSIVGTLSGGWRQRVALSCAIIHKPKILFLDEPTSGVDPVSGRLFWDIVYQLASDGMCVIVSTHSMSEAEHCDEIAFLDGGRVIRHGSPSQLRESFKIPIVAIDTDTPTKLTNQLRNQFNDKLDLYTVSNTIRIRIDNSDDEKLLDMYDTYSVEPTLEDLFVYLSEQKNVASN